MGHCLSPKEMGNVTMLDVNSPRKYGGNRAFTDFMMMYSIDSVDKNGTS